MRLLQPDTACYGKTISRINGLTLSRWDVKHGTGSGPDVQYTDDAIEVANGALVLTNFVDQGINHVGHIDTGDKFQSRYGYYEARIDMTPAEGVQASGSFIPRSNVYVYLWNHGVETDIMEYWPTDWQGNDVSDKVHGAMNWARPRG